MKKQFIILNILLLSLISIVQAQDPILGEIRMFAGNFTPSGWAECDGQLLLISENSALFTVLGTEYGGNGETTFGLPNLRGRLAMHAGNGPDLTPRPQGQRGGRESLSLKPNNVPSHRHEIAIPVAEEGATNDPIDNYLAGNGVNGFNRNNLEVPETTGPMFNTGNNTQGNERIDNIPPFIAVRYIIAIQGIYPSID